MDLRIPLGPFRIQDAIGEGGMARVWRGVHVQQGVDVAIKVMNADVASHPAYRAAFREEVRAVAGFYHPGIILVFDHGTIGAETARASGGEMPEGAPYLAMELASGGSLRELTEALSWPQLRSTLVSLLDALAHAHARGVIHRDLKAANVLLCDASDPRPGLKLTDFGLAHAMDAESGAVKLSGTPRYMAPEQFQGRWRDYGPWTDLYALGILAWELSAGRVPFPEREVEALASAHLNKEPPRHYPRRAVPEGFEAWLLRLLEKEPHRRFRRAADASAALLALPEVEPDRDVVHTPVPTLISNPTIALDTVFLAEADSHTMTLDDSFEDLEPITADHAVIDPVDSQAPPHPGTWRRPIPPAPSIQLVGAGLGLYGLRSIPLVDRNPERDAIWAALGAVRASGEPRVVLLRGAAGNGKSRLVEWMGERAHELGAATVLRAVHSPMGGGADGIVRMLGRHLRTHGLDYEHTRQRVSRALNVHGHYEAWEVDDLARVLDTGATSSPKERYVVIQRHIARLAHERPVIVWLDDVQWGRDALAFARFLCAQEGAGAVLLLLTAQEEGLAERPLEADQLDELLRATEGLTLPVAPLEPEYRAELVERLLNLEGGLARRVEERTGGNPLFAVQLVGDWVQRGALVPGKTGFALREGEEESLPDGLHDVWSAKIRRLLAGLGEAGQTALEVGAALGQEVDKTEWRTATGMLGTAPPADLLAQLAGQRLASEDDETWWFVHGMLRESVERMAREGERWSELNRACAEMLAPRLAEPGIAGRLGRHWLQADRPNEALAPLLAGARHHLEQSEVRAGLALLAVFDEAAEAVPLPATDARRFAADIHRARLMLKNDNRQVEALALVERALEARGPEPAQVAELHLVRTAALRAIGRYRDALAAAEAGRDAYAALDEPAGLRRAKTMVARIEIMLGELASASERLLEVQLDCRQAGDTELYSDTLGDLADIERLRENWTEAASLYRRAMEAAQRGGRRRAYSHQLHGLAEVMRLSGRYEEAERAYRESVDIDARLGITGIRMPHFNLGLVELARGNYSQARTMHEKVRATWEDAGMEGYVGLVDVALLASYAALEDWFFWPSALASAQRAIEAHGMVDVDVAWPAELAGDLAAERGFFQEAREAWRIARNQWVALDKADKAAAIERRIQATLDESGEAPDARR